MINASTSTPVLLLLLLGIACTCSPQSAVELPRRHVGSVIVTPDGASLAVGDTLRLRAEVRDERGAILADEPVEWRALDATLALIDDGFLLAALPGRARIVAEAGDGADTVAVQISLTAASCQGQAPWACRPDGLTMIQDVPWNTMDMPRWGFAERGSTARIVDDTDAPLSGPRVLEHWYPTGFAGGEEPAINEYIFTAPMRTVYVGAYFKFSDGWHGHPSGINKILNVVASTGERWWAVLRAVDDGDPGTPIESGPFFLDVAFCRRYGGDPGTNRSAMPVRVGQWHRLELELRAGTPGGSDGQVRWWVDGVLRGEYTGLDCLGANMESLEIAPTWGGVSDQKRRTDNLRVDHLVIWAR